MAITIEKQAVAHSKGLYLALQDERIYEFLDDEPPNSLEALTAVIERRLKGAPASSGETWLNWTVFQDDVVVGYTQATIGRDRKASFAYVFSPIVWGRSVAYTACVLTLAELEASGLVDEIVADTERLNIRSKRLLARLGFRRGYEDGHDVFYNRTLPLAL